MSPKTHGSNAYSYFVVFVAALGSLTFGFTNAIVGTVLGIPSFLTYFGLALDSSTARDQRIIGAQNGLFFGGGLVGCFALSTLVNGWGRVRGFQVICSISVVAGALQGAAVHIGMLLIGRFLGGIASGMLCSAVPLYQSELSPPSRRGRMVGSHGALLATGFALAGWAAYGCYFAREGQLQWRLLLSLQVVSPALLLGISFWMPESPRWLLMKQQTEAGLETLKRLRRSPEDPNDILAHEEYYQISRQLALEGEMPTTMWELIRLPSYRRRFMLGFFLQVICESTGIAVINNYSVLLYNGLGLTGWKPLLVYAGYATWAGITNYTSSLLIDRVGRVRLFKIGAVSTLLCLIIFTALSASVDGSDNKPVAGAAVAFLFVYLTCFATCMDTNSFVYCVEIFPTNARAVGFSTAVCGWIGTNLVYTEVASTAFGTIKWKFFLVFISVSAATLPFWWLCLPETKDLSLEEIAALFEDEVAIDFTHMGEDERERWDKTLMDMDGKGIKEGEGVSCHLEQLDGAAVKT
ncbi:hypothetical protein FE257_006915 [Aspergillus nanangensis]|uniref:Major facilitator superfamily (MFS) profile domain-containing protein n=1 Tax=Aspergillus nanangensis TaxID=2582783 RepID=A0AAD4GUM6_ASPNN|nr:hypothetical protein FE257_006915 [Aspergillus nanangensis]